MQPARARLTLSGDPLAEATIAAQLDGLSAAVSGALGPSLCALLLVGSYARGEGGVVAAPDGGGRGAHNDFDLVVLVDDVRRWRRPLAVLAHDWSLKLGIEVTLWPAAARSIERDGPPPTLFWLDVAQGGVRLLAGSEAALGWLRALALRQVPLGECGRLLANRAVGLALSNLAGAWGRATRARHAHKAALACGDVRLIAAARYPSTLQARLAELERLRAAPAIGAPLVAAYADALRYRARPDAWTPADGADEADWYAALRPRLRDWHLGFEAWRCGAPASVAAFTGWRGRLYPLLADVRAGGALWASLRAAQARAAALTPWLGHPRERLARVAAALAYAPDDAAVRASAVRLLGGSERDLVDRLRALADRGG